MDSQDAPESDRAGPHAIRNKRAYKAAMHEIRELTTRGKSRSAGEKEYYRVLCALIADYERRVGADRWPKSQVAQTLGDRAAASSILSGRREISKNHARRLGEVFNVDAGVFI